MTNEEFIILAEKVAEGTANMRELALYNAAYESFQQEQKNLADMGLNPLLLKKQSLKRFWDKQDTSPQKFKLWPRIAAAASIIIAIAAGIWFYNNNRYAGRNDVMSGFSASNIGPGKNVATLSINGRSVTLSDAKTGIIIDKDDVKYNDGSVLGGSKAAGKAAALTLTTPRGGTYHVVLPDGTRAWLNADSKISFPVQFSGRTRKIVMSGEAYFEVAKDKTHPFIVRSGGQEVEVLGTHFNIRSYTGEEVMKTTLLEGSVKVSAFGALNPKAIAAVTILKPNQQASVANHAIKVNATDTKAAVAWKEGYFRFNNASIQSVMLELSRWYNIEIVYQGEMTRDGFNGQISRFKNISDVLKMLEETELVHFKVEGRRVIVLR